ncbi:MAG: OstA-like protein [Ignavibacteria bacterium]
MSDSILNIKYFYIVILFLTFGSLNEIYAQEKIELKNAKELTGSTVNGENVREANGNVEFVQGNVKVYCNSATQFITSNRVELRGEVKIYQDTLTLLTNKATYFGNDKRAICEGGVTLKDPNATIRADNGIYTFNEGKAVFTGDVIIINPEYKITSSTLTYMRNTEDSFAEGNVIVTTDSAVIKADKIDFNKSAGRTYARGNVFIESDSTVITSDTATNYSVEKKSIASGNVKIESLNNSSIIYGDYIENYETENFTILKKNAKLIQIEESNKSDTMYIYSDTMKAYRNKPDYYIAEGNVEMIRNEFSAKCGEGIFYREMETVSLSEKPVVWQDRLQLTGDSIYAELPGKKIRNIYSKKLNDKPGTESSFALTSNEDEYFSDRYDQIRGDDIIIKFSDDKINEIEVDNNSSSVYFVYEENKANGANKIEGSRMYLYFDEEEQISKIKIESDPKGEYIPESLLNTVSLILPGFEIISDKPIRRSVNN